MRTYNVTITGVTPLLLHHDNIEWADMMEAWKNDPKNKKASKAGDDRTPAWRWLGCLYHDGEQIVIPQDNVMRSAMEGGTMVPVPGGRSGKTFKAQTQSGMRSQSMFWPIDTGNGPIALSDVEAFREIENFSEHREMAQSLGFDLLVKRAKIGQSKHIRVRPIFNQWEITGQMLVIDEQITTGVLNDIFSYAGQYRGLGDWRPGGRTPGPFGQYEAVVKQVS